MDNAAAAAGITTEHENLLESLARKDNPLRHVPIELSIVIGKARPKISELVKLRLNSILALDSKIEDPVEIYVGSRLIARGELQESQENSVTGLAVRLTEVVDMKNLD